MNAHPEVVFLVTILRVHSFSYRIVHNSPIRKSILLASFYKLIKLRCREIR